MPDNEPAEIVIYIASHPSYHWISSRSRHAALDPIKSINHEARLHGGAVNWSALRLGLVQLLLCAGQARGREDRDAAFEALPYKERLEKSFSSEIVAEQPRKNREVLALVTDLQARWPYLVDPPAHGGARPGSGAKKKSPEQKRSKVVSVPLTEGEVEILDSLRVEAEGRAAAFRRLAGLTR